MLFSAAGLTNLSARITISSFSVWFDVERLIITGSFLLTISSTVFVFLNPFTAGVDIVVYGFGMGFVLGSIYLTGTLLPPETQTKGFSLWETFSQAPSSPKGVTEVFAITAALASMGMVVGLFGQRFDGLVAQASPV